MHDPDVFLRQEVESASPAKLRWLLIRKAIGLCEAIDQLWSDKRNDEAGQWLLRIREIFGELLSGVTDPHNPSAKNVTDLYIFLLVTLEDVEKHQDRKQLRSMVEVLDIELGTWALFVQRENQPAGSEFDSPSRPHTALGASNHFASTTEWAGLNVEA